MKNKKMIYEVYEKVKDNQKKVHQNIKKIKKQASLLQNQPFSSSSDSDSKKHEENKEN